MINMFKKRNNNFGNFGRELGAIKKKNNYTESSRIEQCNKCKYSKDAFRNILELRENY